MELKCDKLGERIFSIQHFVTHSSFISSAHTTWHLVYFDIAVMSGGLDVGGTLPGPEQGYLFSPGVLNNSFQLTNKMYNTGEESKTREINSC